MYLIVLLLRHSRFRSSVAWVRVGESGWELVRVGESGWVDVGRIWLLSVFLCRWFAYVGGYFVKMQAGRMYWGGEEKINGWMWTGFGGVGAPFQSDRCERTIVARVYETNFCTKNIWTDIVRARLMHSKGLGLLIFSWLFLLTKRSLSPKTFYCSVVQSTRTMFVWFLIVCLFDFLSACLFVGLRICLFVCLFVRLLVRWFILLVCLLFVNMLAYFFLIIETFPHASFFRSVSFVIY